MFICRPKTNIPMPIILVQGIDLKKMHPTINECIQKSCRVGFSKNEESIPETEVSLLCHTEPIWKPK